MNVTATVDKKLAPKPGDEKKEEDDEEKKEEDGDEEDEDEEDASEKEEDEEDEDDDDDDGDKKKKSKSKKGKKGKKGKDKKKKKEKKVAEPVDPQKLLEEQAKKAQAEFEDLICSIPLTLAEYALCFDTLGQNTQFSPEEVMAPRTKTPRCNCADLLQRFAGKVHSRGGADCSRSNAKD